MTLPPEPSSEPTPQGQQPLAETARAPGRLSSGVSLGQPVRCRRCEQDLPPGAMFCPHCGTPIEVLCGSCRTANTPGSKFCMHCGQTLDAQAAASVAGAGTQPQTAAPASQTHSDAAPAASPQASPEPAAPSPGSAPPAPDSPAPSTVHEAAPPGAISCPRCHKVNEQAARYCYSCGLPLDETRKAEASAAPLAHEAAFQGRPAGFWVRLAAFVIDAIVLTVAFSAVWPSLFGMPYIDTDAASQNFEQVFGYGADRPLGENIFSILVQAAYFTLTTSFWGATLGKRVFRLRVVGHDGRNLSVARALGRHFATFVSAIIIFIGYLMIAFRPDKRALHDIIAETRVVHK